MAKAELKRKDGEILDEDEQMIDIQIKKKKTSKRNTALDTELIHYFESMSVPLKLMARHGAHFEVEAKKAIRKVYNDGRNYRKETNPLKKTKQTIASRLSHALVVSGMLGTIPCERLVIDPGASISMIDVATARKGPIPVKKDCRLKFQLANGKYDDPIGETKSRQTITIEGIEVRLRMPVVEANNSYDVLLSRDWLHAVNAVAHYKQNQYKISRKGREATLQGQIYTQREVELTNDSSDLETTNETSSEENDEEEKESVDESSETEDSGSDGEVVQAYLTTCACLESFDLSPITPNLEIKRKGSGATIPQQMTEGAAGYDLFAA
jgi:hypothetical protein